MKPPTRSTAAPSSPIDSSRTRRELLSRIVTLRRALETLDRTAIFRRVRAGDSLGPNDVRSWRQLRLDPTETAARLTSSREINTAATSYGSHEPAMAGTSSTQAIVDGVYDGSRGDTTLRFRIRSTGTVGVDPIVIEVYDGALEIDTLDFTGVAPGEAVATNFGLTVSLTPGDAVATGWFDLDLHAGTPTTHDPTAAFDGTGDGDPDLEEGTTIVDGSFLLNGVSIAVGASDSLNDVIARIDASAAGVTARFDPLTDRLTLTQRTAGSTPTITVGDDTSGFLDAFALSTASLVDGTDADAEKDLADVAALAGVTSGTLYVNGVGISVDVQNDSLRDVIARINASGTGAVASYDTEIDRLRVLSDPETAVLLLDDGDTGFFAAAGVEAGTYTPRGRGSGPVERWVARDGKALARALEETVEALNAVFAVDAEGVAVGSVSRARSTLSLTIRNVFRATLDESGTSVLRSDVGLDFDTDAKSTAPLRLDRDDLDHALGAGSSRLHDLLRGTTARRDGAEGFVAEMLAATGDLVEQLGGSSTGSIVDVRA